MAVTMTRIAKEAGVSIAVVSRLLRNDPTLKITEERRKIILATADRLGGIATRRQRRKVQTRTVVMPVNRVFSPEWLAANMSSNQMLRSFEAALAEKKYQLLYTFFDKGREAQTIRAIASGEINCDAIVLGSGIINENIASIIREHGVPHVSHDFHAERFEINTVRANTADGMRQAVDHLVSLGHRHISYVGPRSSYRYPLVVAAVTAAGLTLDRANVCFVTELSTGSDFSNWRPAACKAAAAWLNTQRKATAVIASNDWFAQGMIDAMADAGLKPGRDLSVVGVDNYEVRLDASSEPNLTTIDNPFDQIGKRMAERLLNQLLYEQRQITHESIPAPLIIRQSTGPCQKGS